MKRGLFITVEGPDGSGKSTFAKYLEEQLKNVGIQYLMTREPGGTRIGESVREILLNPEHLEMSARAEALLYAASRAQHMDELIRPAIERGVTVICERFILSSLAYQGYGRELGHDAVARINDFAVGGLSPDITLFFSIDPEITLQRKALDPDRLEDAGEAFHRRVYEGYLQAVPHYRGTVHVIDATQSESDVCREGWQVIQGYLKGSE